VFAWLGGFVTRRAWWVIAVWVVAAVVLIAVAPSLSSVSSSQTNVVPASYESAQAQAIALFTFPERAAATSVFVVKRVDGGALSAADHEQVQALAAALSAAAIPKVAGAFTSPMTAAPDGTAELVTVFFAGTGTGRALQDAVDPLRDTASAFLAGTGLEAGLTGPVAIQADTSDTIAATAKIVAIATVVLIVVLLGLVFRSPLAALLPIAVIGLVYLLSTAVVALLAQGGVFRVDPQLGPLLIVVLFGIGTDYILFLLFRYRERLRAGDESRPAMVASLARVGQAIASSGLVVMSALAVLFLCRLEFFRTIAPTQLVAVGLMLLAALTLVPAVVGLIGPNLFWPSKRWRTARPSRLWTALAGQIARRPGWMALAAGGLLAALSVGALFMHFSYDLTAALPSDTESARATEQLEASFPAGALSPTYMYVAARQPLGEEALTRFSDAIAQVSEVVVAGVPALTADGTAASFTVNLTVPPVSSEALDVVDHLKEVVHQAAGAGEQVRVGGQSMVSADMRAAARRDYLVVLPVGAAVILVILGLLLRSVVAPWYLLAGVWLGFGATLGTSVIFLQGILGEAGVFYFVTMVTYVFVAAVGSDYNILLTSRLQEERAAGASPRDAAAWAVQRTAPTVAAAGLILAGTFASIMLANVTLLTQIGFTVMIGILLVALVMATVFVPSIAALIHGRRRKAAPRPATPAY